MLNVSSIKEAYLQKTVETYTEVMNSLPQHYAAIINLFVFTLLIVIYTIFIWKFYRFLARKDIIKLDLRKYNKLEHPGWRKFLAVILYFAEYIIVLPFIVFFWFAILTFFLILLSKQNVEAILLISAAIVASVRMTSYYKEDLSKDLAKLFPFTILAVFLLSPDFFSFELLVLQFSKIPSLLSNILYYLFFIIGLEIILRFFEIIFSVRNSSEDENEEENKVEVGRE